MSGTQQLPSAVSEATFKAEIVEADGKVRMALGGTADVIAEPYLDMFLLQTHAYVDQQQVKSVVVDIRALEFMNSSCIRVVVAWTLNVARLPDDRQYRIVYVISPRSDWQRRSMTMLMRVAPKIASIEV